jgi:hypothetical protein
VNALEFPVAAELMDYWGEYPPVHLLLRGLIRPSFKNRDRRLNPAEERIAVERAVSLTSLPPSVRRFILSKAKEKPEA